LFRRIKANRFGLSTDINNNSKKRGWFFEPASLLIAYYYFIPRQNALYKKLLSLPQIPGNFLW